MLQFVHQVWTTAKDFDYFSCFPDLGNIRILDLKQHNKGDPHAEVLALRTRCGVANVQWNPHNQNEIVSCYYASGEVHLWDLEETDGEPTHVFRGPTNRQSLGLCDVQWMADRGAVFVAGACRGSCGCCARLLRRDAPLSCLPSVCRKPAMLFLQVVAMGTWRFGTVATPTALPSCSLT